MAGEKTGSNFDELLKSLNAVADDTDTLTKSKPAAVEKAPDDKAIAAASADGDADDEDEEDEGMADDGKTFGKSIVATDANGNEVDAIDATDLIKSMAERIGGLDTTLSKALTGITGVMAKQNDMIKSLQSQVSSLAGQGRGRKTQLFITEKPGIGETLVKSEAASGEGKITPMELMAKSNAAYEAKKISGVELTTVDVCLRMGQAISPELLNRIALA